MRLGCASACASARDLPAYRGHFSTAPSSPSRRRVHRGSGPDRAHMPYVLGPRRLRGDEFIEAYIPCCGSTPSVTTLVAFAATSSSRLVGQLAHEVAAVHPSSPSRRRVHRGPANPAGADRIRASLVAFAATSSSRPGARVRPLQRARPSSPSRRRVHRGVWPDGSTQRVPPLVAFAATSSSRPRHAGGRGAARPPRRLRGDEFIEAA